MPIQHMTDEQIKEIFVAHGFKTKMQPSGRVDLNPYCYQAARALIHAAKLALAQDLA